MLKVTSNNAEVVLVDQPKRSSIFVALKRVRLCYPEQTDETWTGARECRKRRGKKKATITEERPSLPCTGPVTRSQTQDSCMLTVHYYCV